MHCKFLVFLLIVFIFFSFFSSACEFRFFERIGAHGKQNPGFIIVIIRKVAFSCSVAKEAAANFRRSSAYF